MNFLRKLFLATFLLSFSLACEEKDVEPQHYLVSTLDASLFSRSEDFVSLKQQMYSDANTVFTSQEFLALHNLPSLAVGASSELEAETLIDMYQWQAGNPLFEVVWKQLFSAISNVNLIIYQFEEIYRGYEYAEELLLEARFLRVLYIFEFVVLFGEEAVPISPISTTSELRNIQWIKGIELLGFLETELQKVSTLPKSNTQQLKPNYWSVKAIEGKLHLYKASKGEEDSWMKAYRAFSEILNSGQFILEKRYVDLFEPDLSSNIEPIFYTTLSNEETLLKSDLGTSSAFIPSTSFQSLFVQTDNRLNSILELENNQGFIFKKYNKSYYQGQDVPFYILRLADIWLLHSEILNHVLPNDRARLTGINLIKDRSGLTLLSNTLNNFEFQKYIQEERERELILEAKSLFDYRRWGLEFMRNQQPNLAIDEKHLVFPIPQAILEDAHFDVYKQHRGY